MNEAKGVPNLYLQTCPECRSALGKFLTQVQEPGETTKRYRMLCEACDQKYALMRQNDSGD